jgi:CDP-paratose 2-epimerase
MTARLHRAPSGFGFVEWFRPGEYARTEDVLPEIVASGASHLRTHLSWAEYLAPGGEEWFDWLLPKLAAELDVLPCIHYTPPSLSRTGKATGAPRRLKDYADFVDHVIDRYGRHFRHIELWNEPNNLLDWDWREDKDFSLFCEMVGGAAYWVQKRGWKAVLGAPCPFDPAWINLMGQRGVLDVVSAVGFHGFPGTWDSDAGSWNGWDLHLGELRRLVDGYNPDAELWVTETGYSTWRQDEVEQVRRFMAALTVPADRVYWYSWRDVPHDVAVQEGLWFDPRHYHLGATEHGGRPKLLARLLQEGGVRRVQELFTLAAPSIGSSVAPVVITGGSGFIGSNLAASYLREGKDVVIFDSLARPGVDSNLAWLRGQFGDRVHGCIADVRDAAQLRDAVRDASVVFHLAGQTAVTTSLENPIEDMEVNVRGTLNVLEAARAARGRPGVIFASTNKVYGALEDVDTVATAKCHQPADPQIARNGIGEDRGLDFCTPYGCSKGAADQYVLDYAKSYGTPAAVLRMSCIYGPRQFGTEDQGWVAHFLIRALGGEKITIFGDGRQVRDILDVDDAVAAYRALHGHVDRLSGQAFNLGGGPSNAVSLAMVLAEMARIIGEPIETGHEPWRTGDQLYFVADTARLQAATGWRPTVPWQRGVLRLARWLQAERFGDAASARHKRLSA